MAEPPHDEGGGNGEQQAVMPALVAGIHVLKAQPRKTWMAGTRPAMTKEEAPSERKWCQRQTQAVMPALVAGLHVLKAEPLQRRRWLEQSGHDEAMANNKPSWPRLSRPSTYLGTGKERGWPEQVRP